MTGAIQMDMVHLTDRMGKTEECWSKCLENAGRQGTGGFRLSPWTAKLEEEGAGGADERTGRFLTRRLERVLNDPTFPPRCIPLTKYRRLWTAGLVY